jgi:hypothetical protein
MRESIITLPTEVLEEIISYISYDDIAALAQTSKRLWQIASPKIHSVIPLLASQRIRRYVQRLSDDPQRATHILETHLPQLMPREERRKPSPWSFDTVLEFLTTALERAIPLPFVAVESYAELGRTFENALLNMTHLRILVVHSRQHGEIWDNDVVIPSLRKIYVYPKAETPYLWRWTMRQNNLTTLRNCWHDNQFAQWWPPSPPSPPACGPTAFPKLQTLITNPVGVDELIYKTIVSDLTIHTLPPVHPDQPTTSTGDTPPFLHKLVRSNKRTPLRRITLSGTLDRICFILQVLQFRDSLPPHVRLFFEQDIWQSERNPVSPSA